MLKKTIFIINHNRKYWIIYLIINYLRIDYSNEYTFRFIQALTILLQSSGGMWLYFLMD